MLIGGSIIFAAVLIFLGSLLVSDPSGYGRVAGIIMGEDNHPLTQGVKVRFPDLGETIAVNGQGMFYTNNLPAGSHKVEVIRGGQTWTSDFATVTDGEISLIAFYPPAPAPVTPTTESIVTAESGAAKPAALTTASSAPSTTVPAPQSTPAKPQSPAQQAPNAPAKLTLAANVEGATLQIDGSPVGEIGRAHV